MGSHIRTDAVYVVFTSRDSTLCAVHAARELASALDASVIVLRFRPVPYALPLSVRSALPDPELDRFATAVKSRCIDASVRTYFCRSDRDAAALALPARSLVLVGSRRTAWPFTPARAWRRRLEAMGHCVILIRSFDAHVLPARRARIAAFSRGIAGASMKEKARA